MNLRYILALTSGPMSFPIPAHCLAGEQEPAHVEGVAVKPPGLLTFEHFPDGQFGEVESAAVKHLLQQASRTAERGNAVFLGAIKRGALRFNASDLRELGYTGPIPATVESALGAGVAPVQPQAPAISDRELESLRLRASIADSERRSAEALLQTARLHAASNSPDGRIGVKVIKGRKQLEGGPDGISASVPSEPVFSADSPVEQ